MSIRNWARESRDKLRKPYIQIGIAVVLLCLLSFGAGYLLGRDFNPVPIVIEKHSGA